MGLTAAPTLIAAQSSVEWGERGVVTANNIFLRSLGSSLGVAVFGAIANATIRTHPDPARLTAAVHHIFIGMVIVAAVMIVTVALMPRGDRPEPDAQPATDQPASHEPVTDQPAGGPPAAGRPAAN